MGQCGDARGAGGAAVDLCRDFARTRGRGQKCRNSPFSLGKSGKKFAVLSWGISVSNGVDEDDLSKLQT